MSYVWGDKSKRSSVILNNGRLSVAASSEAAIRRMRLPDRDRVLWIDAVCIDQANNSDRSQQVIHMREIYGCGVRNLVYLGEDNEGVKQALEDIERLLEDMRDETNGFRGVVETLCESDGRGRTSPTPLKARVQDWKNLAHFYSNAWFSRLWIVQ